MKRLLTVSRVIVATAALAVVASTAFAAEGINLSWNECGLGGALQRNFACASNSGSNSMYGSAIAPVPMPQLNGAASVLDLQTNEAALSNWWQLATGGCRAGLISANFNFLTAPGGCADPWGGNASGGISYTPAFGGANRARIRPACAIPGSYAMDNVTEHYMFIVTITNGKSTGTGACTGCQDGVCIVYNSILLTQPLGVGNYTITNPITQAHVQWQAGGATVGIGCPAVTPTRKATWGSVKSLYR